MYSAPQSEMEMQRNYHLGIRPLEMRDAPALHALRIMPGVQETISGIYSERIAYAEAFVASLTDDDHHFVAEITEENGTLLVIGSAGIHVNAKPRKRHSALLGIMVATEWQAKGIGRKMLERIIDLSDNWLMLLRLELSVFASNEHAVRLYESFGFQVEGRLRAASVMNGKYVDELIMGRIRRFSEDCS